MVPKPTRVFNQIVQILLLLGAGAVLAVSVIGLVFSFSSSGMISEVAADGTDVLLSTFAFFGEMVWGLAWFLVAGLCIGLIIVAVISIALTLLSMHMSRRALLEGDISAYKVSMVPMLIQTGGVFAQNVVLVCLSGTNKPAYVVIMAAVFGILFMVQLATTCILRQNDDL